jgi:hypothetical protein
LHVRGDVAGAVERHADIGMPQPFLDDLGVHPLRQQRRARVLQIVKPEVVQTRLEGTGYSSVRQDA